MTSDTSEKKLQRNNSNKIQEKSPLIKSDRSKSESGTGKISP